MMKHRNLFCLFVLCIFYQSTFAQSLLGTFNFNEHLNCTTNDSRIIIGALQEYTSNGGTIDPTPQIVDDGVVKSMFFKVNAWFGSGNNINFAIAPAIGESLIITSVRFRLRFACTNGQGNAGVFVTKKNTDFENSTGVKMIWTTGNNNVHNNYVEYSINTSYYDDLFRSKSNNDSIRFLIAHGSNTLGCYIDSLKLYGYISKIPVEIDADQTSKILPKGIVGANMCWFMDKDITTPAGDIRVRETSNADRFEEMNIGALRFPYGHLAENYLWHVPTSGNPFPKNTSLPLNPQVATTSRAPANFSWAVNPDKTFINSMDFDEFITLCQDKNIEPVIVVNLQSSKYSGGPTQETLINTAKEWVRYANITKSYNVKYWQIGNEVDHDGLFTREEYIAAYKAFATAMKSVDSTIKIGTGVLNKTSWNKAVRDSCTVDCSFFSTHNYQFSSTVAPEGLSGWSQDTTTYASNGEATQNMINNNFAESDIEILITESNITGGNFPTIIGQEEQKTPNLYKALYFFEETMNLAALKNVKYNIIWNIHSPWDYHINGAGGFIIDNLLSNNYENVLLPQGNVVKLINNYLKDKLIVMRRVNGPLRTYASISDDNKSMSVFILNKSDTAQRAIIKLSNLSLSNALIQRANFTGTSPYSQTPWLTSPWTIQPSQLQNLSLPAYSVTVLNITSSLPMKQGYFNTGVSERHENSTSSLYFNGVDKLVYKLSDETTDSMFFTLFEISGKQIMSSKLVYNNGVIDVRSLKPGIYIARLKTCNEIKTVKFVL